MVDIPTVEEREMSLEAWGDEGDIDEEDDECGDGFEMACQCYARDDGLIGPHEFARCYGGDV